MILLRNQTEIIVLFITKVIVWLFLFNGVYSIIKTKHFKTFFNFDMINFLKLT